MSRVFSVRFVRRHVSGGYNVLVMFPSIRQDPTSGRFKVRHIFVTSSSAKLV